ncbi:hypothetical protein SPRG_15587 [Saprolegnia parasitica CBS 223.65]|uniref:PH domain-containing protein n=1 Tax=Saprolegnia parasitica (strain CBS 223.65) TaxID=695850 RepID=A0A067BNT9_SAPPC|nr:hypothetical protein SPRG_15587 [Saprolegnia parasitica CBS 223.65]KDO18420.1 hypothetical protein SPRG_15587 [Saprolegnia parasitica CBS 223.65]|eukprot:XP_012210870.1 hypothetical protein SPRG_15587 [Saprolegnia parasitica CBS 223.65]
MVMTTSPSFVKAGVLFKKGSGQGLFKRRNWKPRYFELSEHHLRWYSYQNGTQKGQLNLAALTVDALEVMPSDAVKKGSSASTIWRIAIRSGSRRLLISAANESEMNEWLLALVGVLGPSTADVRMASPSKKIVLASERPEYVVCKRHSRVHSVRNSSFAMVPLAKLQLV